MKKRAAIGAALAGLLFPGAAALSQDPEPVERQVAPPTFRDVLRGKIGQKVYYRFYPDSGARVLNFGRGDAHHTLVGVGEDFVQIREDAGLDAGLETFISLSRVDVEVKPAGK